MEAKCNAYSIDINSQLNLTMEENIKLANALRIKIKRIAEKKGTTLFTILVISERNGKDGHYIPIYSDKKGRPSRAFISKESSNKVNPHLHILMYGFLANSIS